MRDFNFFEPYKQEPKKKTSMGNLIIIFTAGVVALCCAMAAFNIMSIMQLEKSISTLDTNIADPRFKERFANVQVKQDELNSLKKDRAFFEALGIFTSKRNKVNEAAVKLIANQVPDNLFLTELNIEDEIIDIKGKTYNKVAVAQLQHNLRQTKEFDDLFVSEMVEEDEAAFYNFSIELGVKEDKTDEN